MLVDVHAHLDYFDDNELKVVIEKCKKVNVKTVITNGTNPKSNRSVLKIARTYPMVKAALGLYPTNALEMTAEDIKDELKFISTKRDSIVAVGEVGLDYYWVTDKNKEQREIFSQVIKLCEKIKKPIIVHSRKAEADVISMLESSKIKHIIMHCFGGRLSMTKQIRDYGWNMSIPTNIVRSIHFQRIVEEMPVGQLLTESDSPYLAPVNDVKNDPSNIPLVVQKIAEIKKLDIEECTKMIYQNYMRVF